MLRGSSSHLEFRSHKSNWLEIVCEPHELGQTIYWLSAKLASAGSLLAKLLICSVDYDIMHHHFSHPSKDVLRHASGTTLGFPSITFPHEECICPRCAEGKITRSMFPHDFTCMLEFMNKNQAQFQEQITQAISALTSSRVTPPDSQASHSGSTVKLRNPWVFNSRHEEVVPFLSEVQHIIEFHPSGFPDDHWKVLFVAMYLKDRIPIEWFNHLEVIRSLYLHNWLQFMSKFWKKFTDPQLSSTADQKLEKLKQTGSANTYLPILSSYHLIWRWPSKQRSITLWKDWNLRSKTILSV